MLMLLLKILNCLLEKLVWFAIQSFDLFIFSLCLIVTLHK